MELSQDDCLLRPEHFAAVARALKYDSREGLVKGLSEVELSVLAAVRARVPARPPARPPAKNCRAHAHTYTCKRRSIAPLAADVLLAPVLLPWPLMRQALSYSCVLARACMCSC